MSLILLRPALLGIAANRQQSSAPVADTFILNFTDKTGMYQTSGSGSPVTANGQTVHHFDKDGLTVTTVTATITAQAAGLVTSGTPRMNVAVPFTLRGAVIAATPSTGDASSNHGILGGPTNYLTIGSNYRWRDTVDATVQSPGVSRSVMQIAVFEFVEETGEVLCWTDGIAGATVSGKAALLIERFFHRASTVSYLGTAAWMALSDQPFSQADRRAYIKEAAEQTWTLPGGRIVIMGDDVPFNMEIDGVDDPAGPFLLSHHGSNGKTLDEATYGTYGSDRYSTGGWTSEFDLIAYSPTFDDTRFNGSTNYQQGGYVSGGGGRHTAAIEEGLVTSVREHLGQPDKAALLFGFSAGAQYMSRVAAYNPVSNVQRYVIGSPSTWVAPIRVPTGTYTTADCPYGFANMGFADAAAENDAIRAYVQLPITVYYGEDDNNPSDPDLGDPSNSLGQGAHRRERAEKIYALAVSQAAALGVQCNWTLVMAAGVGHSGGAMLNAPEAAEAFFPSTVSNISFVNINQTASNNVTVPATVAGDIAFLGAGRISDSTVPTVPTTSPPWLAPTDNDEIDISNSSATGAGFTRYKFPTTSGENSGTCTNSQATLCAAYRGVRSNNPILAMKFASGNGTEINIPGLDYVSDTAWIAIWYRHGGSTAATPSGDLSGNRALGSNRGWFDSAGPMSSFAGTTFTIPSAQNWECCAIAFESN